MLGEHCGKFLCAVIAVIEENHHMSCAYAAVYTVVDYRLDKLVGNALCVLFLNSLEIGRAHV